jgi:1,4-dihydroxy-6-naphthoate synthase
MEQTLRLCYSPCPNDTYIFYGLAHGRVDVAPFRLNIDLADVETLNRRAAAGEFHGRPDVCKVSASALTNLLDAYWILSAGGALGHGCGPLMVTRESYRTGELDALLDLPLAIPGRMTTAFLLYRLFAASCDRRQDGHRGEIVEMRYDQIMPAVASGDVGAGLLIHEGRFTYQAAGLRLALDLGAWWEETTSGAPLPLGVIVMKRALGRDAALGMETAIRASIDYSRTHPEEPMDYIRRHAQELDDRVIGQHIQTFVNDLSLDPGEAGRNGLRLLLDKGLALEGRALPDLPLFP